MQLLASTVITIKWTAYSNHQLFLDKMLFVPCLSIFPFISFLFLVHYQWLIIKESVSFNVIKYHKTIRNICPYVSFSINVNPYHQAGTFNNVGSTSMQRRPDVASTLRRRCINVVCLLGITALRELMFWCPAVTVSKFHCTARWQPALFCTETSVMFVDIFALILTLKCIFNNKRTLFLYSVTPLFGQQQ